MPPDPAPDLRPTRVAMRAAAMLPAAALALAGWTLSGFEGRAGGATAAETAYLAAWAAFVLAGAALLAPPRHRGSLLAPTVVATAIWALPPGPARGVAVGVALVAAAAAAAWARLAPGWRERWDGAAWLGLAFALHGLLRPADLLPAALSPLAHGPGSLARVLLPPLAAALALALLARRRGPAATAAAAASAGLVAGGMTATAALPLLALALAAELSVRREARPRQARPASLLGGDLRGVLRAPGGWAAGLAASALLGLVLLRPAAGGLALAAGAAATLPGLPGLAAAALPLVAGAGLALGRAEGLEALAGLWQLAFLLPVALLPGLAPARTLLAALLLGAGGLLLVPGPPALAAGAALLALGLRRGAPEMAAQRVWLATLLALATLAAAYPWLRPEPFLAAAALLGAPAGWMGAAAAVAGAVAAAGAARLAERRRAGGATPARAAAAAALVAAGLAVAAAMPPLARDLVRGAPVELGAGGTWSHAWRGPVRWLRLETLLADAAAVPAGTPAAEVRLESGGQVIDRLVLRAGRETAEWAADRADLRGRVASAPPALSWVSADGRSFGRAYRVAWRRGGGPVDRVVVVRSPHLPPQAVVVVRRLEVAR